jgi:hypothetical protein
MVSYEGGEYVFFHKPPAQPSSFPVGLSEELSARQVQYLATRGIYGDLLTYARSVGYIGSNAEHTGIALPIRCAHTGVVGTKYRMLPDCQKPGNSRFYSQTNGYVGSMLYTREKGCSRESPIGSDQRELCIVESELDAIALLRFVPSRSVGVLACRTIDRVAISAISSSDRVVLFPDNDSAGMLTSLKWGKACRDLNKPFQIIRVPAPMKDIGDLLASQTSPEGIGELLASRQKLDNPSDLFFRENWS